MFRVGLITISHLIYQLELMTRFFFLIHGNRFRQKICLLYLVRRFILLAFVFCMLRLAVLTGSGLSDG